MERYFGSAEACFVAERAGPCAVRSFSARMRRLPVRSNSLDLRGCRRFVLVVVRSRDLLLVEEGLIAGKVCLVPLVDGLRLFQFGNGAVEVVLRSGERSVRGDYFRLLRGEIVLVADLSDRQVRVRSAELSKGLVVLRLRLLQRNLVVAGIKLNQQFSCLHGLVVVHMDGGDGAIDARGDRIQMAVHLGIIRILIALGVDIPSDANSHQHKHDRGDREFIDATRPRGGHAIRFERWFRLNFGGGVGGVCISISVSVNAHLLVSFE